MPSLGIRIAEEEINKAGGVLGRKLEIMSEDSVNPATAATKAANACWSATTRSC